MAEIFNFDEVVTSKIREHWGGNAFWDLRGIAETIDGFVYGPMLIETIPNKVQELIYVNDADAVGTQRISDTKTTTATLAWTLRKTVSSSSTQSIKVPLPKGIEISANQSQQVSLERTDSQTHTVTQSWSWDTTIPIPARSQLNVEIVVDEIETKCDFTASATFSGEVVIVKITIGEGLQRIRFGVGDFFARYIGDPRVSVIDNHAIAVPIEGELRNREGRKYHIEVHQLPLQGDAKPTSFKALVATRSMLGVGGMMPTLDGDTIGTPDGISYRIVSTRDEVRPTPACGYNDAMAPIAGSFKIETRFYEEFRDGSLVRSWTEDVETFDHCIDV